MRRPQPAAPCLSALLLIGLAASCSDSAAPSDAGGDERVLTIVAPGPDVGLTLGGEQTLRVRCSAHASPVADARIQFAIFDDPRGSTLSADAATTSLTGEAVVQVRAGAVASRFQVHVSAPRAKAAVFYVEVSDAGFGSVAVKAQYSGPLTPQLDRVRYTLLREVSCSSIQPLQPPPALRERMADDLAASVTFSALPLNVDHTILAVAQDKALRSRAAGCLEVPRGVPKATWQPSLLVDLRDLQPQIVGSYSLLSDVLLPKSPAPGSRPLADALRPWSDLIDCHDDPAQLLLDCVLDALDGGDPLDCQIVSPSSKTLALLAERGALSGGCRGEQTDRGTQSLDRKLRMAMDGAGATTLAALAGLVPKGSTALRQLQLQSTLVVLSLDAAGAASLAHRLDGIAFVDGGAQALFKTQEVGLPQPLAAPVAGSVDGWRLKIGAHSFSLRYGLLARTALDRLVVVPAGLPAGSASLATSLAALVKQTSPAPLAGCPAIEAIACEAARLPAGCLGAACVDGVAALAAYLDQGFTRIDNGADLSWHGEVDLIDEKGDLVVDRLGTKETPGLWSAQLQLGPEPVVPQEATFYSKHP